MSFAFELTSGQWTCSAENWPSAFCEFHKHSFSNNVPYSLWTVLQRNEFGIRQALLFIVFDQQQTSLNIDINMIVLLKFSGVSPNLKSKLLTSSLSCNVLNPGKIFHSSSIGSPSILSKFLNFEDFKHPKLCSHASLGSGFSKIFPRHNKESEKT